MSWEDALGAVDPQQVLNSQITQRMPEVAQSDGSVDPQTVMNRLIRKGLAQKPQATAADEKPDFSKFGVTKDQVPPTPDFSKFGETADEQKQPATVTGTAPVPSGTMASAGQSLVAAPVNMAGAALKGAAVLAGEPPQEGDFTDPMSGQAMLAPGTRKPRPVTQDPLYQAGAGVEKWSNENLAPTPETKQAHPIATGIAGGVGSVLPLVALGAISPAAAIAGGAGIFGLSGAGETYDHAIEHGASEETARSAAALSGAANSALGAIPIASVLKPFKAFMPEASGLAMRILGQAAEQGVVFASVGEAQEFIGAQISRMYDPKAGTLGGYQLPFTAKEATDRLLANLGAGVILGGLHGALAGKGTTKEAETAADAGAARGTGPSIGAHGEGPQPQPGLGGAGAGPRPGRGGPDASAQGANMRGPTPGDTVYADPDEAQYWTESGAFDGTTWANDNVKAKAAGKKGWAYNGHGPGTTDWGDAGAQQQAGAKPGAQAGPKAAPEPPPEPFKTELKQAVREKLEEKAAYYKEHSPETIASWSDDELKDYVNKKFGYGSKRADDDEILKRYGVSPDEAATMSPEQKAATVDEAVRNGVHTGETDEGRRNAPVDLKTAADVRAAEARANQEHSPAQGEANNIQRGHATWNGLDITLEAPKGGVRRGTAPDGTPFETSHPHAYGYFKDLPQAADGQHPDVIVGDHPNAPSVYVIDELDRKTKQFRQTKTFAGFQTPHDAVASYLGISTKDRSQIGGVRSFSRAEFEQFARGGGLTGPVSEAGAKWHEAQSERPVGAETNGAQDLTTFTTAKGSAYQVHEDGTTSRDKAFRPEHGAAEQGPQPRSDRTVYVKPKDSQRLALPQGGNARVIEHGNGTLSIATKSADGKWGIAPSARNVPFETKPSVGANPIELWGKETVNGREAYKRIHLGNAITKVSEPAPRAPIYKGTASPEPDAGPPEATPRHHAAVEAALHAAGVNPAHVRAADIARAAEISAADGISPEEAFPIAVATALIEDGHIAPETAKEVLGNEETQKLLDAGERTRGEPFIETPSAATRGPSVPAAPELGKGGGAHEPHPRGENAEGGSTAHPEEREHPVQHAAGGERPAEANVGDNGKGAGAVEHEPAEAASDAVKKPAKSGGAWTGGINNEAYKDAAKKRKEAAAGGSGALKIYGSTRGKTEAQGIGDKEGDALLEKATMSLDAAMKKAKISFGEEVPDELRPEIISLVMNRGYAPLDAVDYAMAKFEREANLHSDQEVIDSIDGTIEREEERHADVLTKAPHQGGAERTADEGVSPKDGGDSAGDVERPEREHPATERTAAGEQHVVPGAERISDAELAQRRADERLKPKAEQKPADEGLFSDESKQTDLIDQIKKKPAEPTPAVEQPRQEKIPGTRDIAQRIVNAEESFADGLMERAGISREDAYALTAFYLKRKLAKLDSVGGRISVKHGGYLDPDAIHRAVAMMKKSGAGPKNQPAVAASKKIEDFGEKVGGARKDVAAPSGGRGGQKETKDDERPTWAKRFSIQQVDVKRASEGPTGIAWEIHDERTGKPLMDPQVRWRPYSFATKEEAERVLPLAAVALKHRVVSSADNKTFRIIRDVTDRKRVTIKDGFADRESALRYLHDHATEILETKTGFGEEILAAPEKVNRVGADRRKGDVDEKSFSDTFGFRGVEFGNWNNQPERQEVMNHAFDGLLDLADILNVPPKALSLDGQLAIAFGARGHGLSGARAHYERDYGVINLTKMSGAGSLAHEWMHAFDAYLARLDTKASAAKIKNERGDQVYSAGSVGTDYISHGAGYKSKLRDELKAALNEVADTINTKAETYVENTEQADKWLQRSKERLGGYLDTLRSELAKKRDYGTRNVNPANAEQLARFDALADKLRNGEDISTSWKVVPSKKVTSVKARYSNDTIDGISAIHKEVRGRSGFSEGKGPLDQIVHAVNDLKKRSDMMEQAAKGSEKTRRVPTQFARDAHNLDQGRSSDYWSTPHELIARAMSSYVEDKIAAQSSRSDFLSYGSDNALYRIFNARPFPEGAEREAINAAFDKFFGTLKHDEGTKPGDIALSQSMPVSSDAKAEPEFLQPSKGLKDEAEVRRVDEAQKRRRLREMTKSPTYQYAVESAWTRAAELRRAEIAQHLTDLVQQMTGKRIAVRFRDRINQKGEGWGENVAETAAGNYLPIDNMIRLALTDPRYPNPIDTAFHEAWHAIEDHFASDHEMALLKGEEPRLREIAGRYLATLYSEHMSPEEAMAFAKNKLADFEVRAVAFQAYAAERAAGGNGTGMHIGVRQFFERMMNLLRRFANYLRSLGFNTSEDVFGKAYEGGMKERPSRKLDQGEGSRIVSAVLDERARANGAEEPAASATTPRVSLRTHGMPPSASEPISEFRSAEDIKSHPDYGAAKAGDAEAAIRLVRDLVTPANIEKARTRFGADAVYVPVHGQEATGRNAIPYMLAQRYATATGADVADEIVQANKAYHTGAGPMERLDNRAIFDGAAERGKKYVLVDDTSVMGSTLADLANHIQKNGGDVVGVVLLANAGRSSILTPTPAIIRDIERRHGDATKDLLNISPNALTADEAAYLRNFRNADELRDRITAAKRQRTERLGSKGLLPEGIEDHGSSEEPTASMAMPDDGGFTLGAMGDPVRTIKAFKDFWTSTFQPELVSDRAFEADPLFARYKSRQSQDKDAVIAKSEHEWNYWNKKPLADRLRFLSEWEHGATPANPEEAAMMQRWKRILEENWQAEKNLGSKAGYVRDYLAHIWKDPEGFNAWTDKKFGTDQVGPTWFQKGRTFQFIEDGLAAGFELKYTNPMDIVVHRLLSGVDMRQRMDLLRRLKEMGMAWEGEQGGEQLVKRGWRAINAPDRKQWVIAPDAQLLWKNAVDAKGLWQAEHVGGSAFRGWMAIKNAWVPIKLALSAFHPLHVMHIDQANSLALAWDQLVKGKDLAGALKSAGEGLATLPTAGMIHYKKGALARQAWQTRLSEQTPEQKAMTALMISGGFVPQLSEQMKIASKRQLAEAWQNIRRGDAGASDWRKFVSASMRRPIEKLQGAIFEKWIPALKAAAYLNQAAAVLKRNPYLLQDDAKRRVALRAVSKSIDNRYGEMNYGTLFWNRTTKDASIASFLSLGWNLGFVREFGGAAFETVSRPAGLLPPLKASENRKVAREATNKIPFVLAYVGTAALINGIMTYLFTGEMPEGLDYIFARIGGVNPDGSPRRVANMFYLREVPMLIKHIQEQGGNVYAGSRDMLYNKLMFEPFNELLNNRNYYGYNIWDENAPVYKQFWQALKYEYASQFSPMSITGAKHAADLSGKPFPSISEAIADPGKLADAVTAKGVLLSVAGFGPAPAYVEKSATQNRIGFLYREHVAPVSKPEEKGETAEDQIAARTALTIAKRDHDWKGVQDASAKLRALGVKQKSINDTGKTPTDVYQFSRLPNEDQKAILSKASPEERGRYWPKAHSDVKVEINRARASASSISQ